MKLYRLDGTVQDGFPSGHVFITPDHAVFAYMETSPESLNKALIEKKTIVADVVSLPGVCIERQASGWHLEGAAWVLEVAPLDPYTVSRAREDMLMEARCK